MWEKIRTWHNDHEYLVWIVLLATVLRIPSLFEPYWYGDEGVYLTLGLAIKRGLTLYSQIHDNKPPLLYLFSALAGNLMWLRVMLMVWNAVSVFVMGRLAEALGFKKWIAYLVALVFGIFTTLPLIEGNIANGELFMIMPAIAGVLLLLQITNHKSQITKIKYLAVGLLFAIGFLFKVPIVFDLFGIGLWMVFFQDKKIFDLSGLRKGLWVGLGFVVPVALVTGYFFINGAGWEFVHAAFLQNVTYLASWRTGYIAASGVGNQSGLVMRLGVAIVATILVWVLTLKEKNHTRLIYVWFIWALFGALLSERPYPHYLIEVVAPASLLIGNTITSKIKWSVLATVLLVGLLVAGIFKYKFYFFPVGKYYINFGEYITKKIPLKTYYDNFDPKTEQTYLIASYLKTRTAPEESVFIWGDEPYIYALAERLPPGRFTVAYHILDFDGKDETLKAIEKEKTPYVVILSGVKQFKELNSLITAKYAFAARIGQAVIYRRIVK